MELTAKVEDIKQALKKARLTISPSDTNIVLQNFAIRAENGKLVIIATDLQLATVCEIPAVVHKPGVTTLPGVKLLSIVDNSSSDELDIRLEDDGKNAAITSGAYNAKLVTLPFDDYPRIEDFLQENSTKTDRADMLTKLNRISFSVSDNEAKRNLLAVYINDGLMQATDGQVTTVVDFDANFTNTLIPALAVKDLVRILRASESQDVELCASDNFLLFRLGTDLFMTRLSTARFPDIPKRIIKPTEKNNIILKADRANLRAAVNRVGVTASDKSLAICLDIKPNNGKSTIILSSSDLMGNASNEEVDAEFNQPEPVKMYLNYTRILDILNALTNDTVELKINQDRRLPIRVEEPDPKFMCFTMRLSEQVLQQPTTPSPDGPANADHAPDEI